MYFNLTELFCLVNYTMMTMLISLISFPIHSRWVSQWISQYFIQAYNNCHMPFVSCQFLLLTQTPLQSPDRLPESVTYVFANWLWLRSTNMAFTVGCDSPWYSLDAVGLYVTLWQHVPLKLQPHQDHQVCFPWLIRCTSRTFPDILPVEIWDYSILYSSMWEPVVTELPLL